MSSFSLVAVALAPRAAIGRPDLLGDISVHISLHILCRSGDGYLKAECIAQGHFLLQVLLSAHTKAAVIKLRKHYNTP